MLEDFVREILKNMKKYTSIEWLKELFEKRLDFLEKEVTFNQSESIDWRMQSPHLPEQYIKFKRFLESNMEAETLKNMFKSIGEARNFVKNYSGDKKIYSCTMETFGCGKRASIIVRKTKDALNAIKNTQKYYKKESELIKKQMFLC